MGESSRSGRSLMDRLSAGPLLCAEGYLFELERRGYLQAGAYVPEVVLEFPEVVMALHREFLRAGSDVIEAFTYYGHREKLRLIGKEDRLEPLQQNALAIAQQIAAETPGEPPLVAGNICNTNVWDPQDRQTDAVVQAMFDEQVNWAANAGVDYIIAETFSYYGEARLALDAIKRAGLTAVITLAMHQGEMFRDGVSFEDAAKRLEQGGAEVVGLNCARGPADPTAVCGAYPAGGIVSCGGAAGGLSHDRCTTDVSIPAGAPVSRVTRGAVVSHRARSVYLHPLRDGSLCPTGVRAGYSLYRRVVVAAPRIISGPWPRRWAVSHRPVDIHRICRNITHWVRIRACGRWIRTLLKSFDGLAST